MVLKGPRGAKFEVDLCFVQLYEPRRELQSHHGHPDTLDTTKGYKHPQAESYGSLKLTLSARVACPGQRIPFSSMSC